MEIDISPRFRRALRMNNSSCASHGVHIWCFPMRIFLFYKTNELYIAYLEPKRLTVARNLFHVITASPPCLCSRLNYPEARIAKLAHVIPNINYNQFSTSTTTHIPRIYRTAYLAQYKESRAFRPIQHRRARACNPHLRTSDTRPPWPQ